MRSRENRNAEPCPGCPSDSPEDLILLCPDCQRFYQYCCFPSHRIDFEENGRVCHHHQIVFTDGACSSNGRDFARAGIGLAMGQYEEDQWSTPIDDSLDPDGKRTSQRAELLAAIEGVRKLYEDQDNRNVHMKIRRRGMDTCHFIVTTDSEYVVKGMTEWIYNWKANDWRTAQGTRPANLDLFIRLDNLLNQVEASGKIEVGFWHVPREYNTLADRLAKNATRAS